MEKVEKIIGTLLNRYREKYPHNPEGVLRFHMEKMVKNGLSYIESLIRLSYKNGVKIEEVEEFRKRGLSFDNAVKEAAVQMRDLEGNVREIFLSKPRTSIDVERMELEKMMNKFLKVTKSFLIVTTPTIPNYRIVRVIGPVSGLTIRSRGFGGQIEASLEALFGGELTSLTYEFEKARLEALMRLIENAKKMGANAVVGVDFETSDIRAGMAIAFSVYGTAVIVERVKAD